MNKDIVNNTCGKCGSPCWQGMAMQYCVNPTCQNYDEKTGRMWLDELRKPVDGEFGDDVPTEPKYKVAADPDDQALIYALTTAVDTAKADPDMTAADIHALDEWLADILDEYLAGISAESAVKGATKFVCGFAIDDWHRDRLFDVVPAIRFALDVQRQVISAIRKIKGNS